MTVRISTVSNNQYFSTWLERTRQLCEIMSSNVLTADATANGSLTTGNVQVNGYFYATTFATAGLRGGNVASSDILNIVANTAFKNFDSSANVATVLSNSTTSSFNVTGNNVTVSPSSNVNVGGTLLNISTTTVNVTSTTLNTNTVITQTGNVSIKANSSQTILAITGNSSTQVITSSAANTNVNGSRLTVGANAVFNGNTFTFSSNTVVTVTANLAVNGTLNVNNAVFTADIITKGLAVNGTFIALRTAEFDANVVFDSTLFVINTVDDKITVAGATADNSSVITVNGTITADTFRFPDGSLVPTANGLTSISQANSSIAVNGSGQIVFTVNNSTVGTIDAGSNNYNFSGAHIRTANLVASGLVQGATANIATANVGSITVNTYVTSIATKIEVPNTSVITIDNVATASVRACDWTIELEDANTFSYQLSKIMAIHDGTGTQTTEYAVLNTNTSIGSITTDISGGQMRLRLTPTLAPCTVKIVRSGITA